MERNLPKWNCFQRIYLNGYQGVFGHLDDSQDIYSARDIDGHGTHLASIVAGRTVPNVTGYGGFAGGTASGGAPLARLAIYKVCWVWPGSPFQSVDYCNDIDIMKAFDDAIGDGVDIISSSFGFDDAQNFVRDPLAIASLHAMKKNVVVVSTAGNDGPKDQTVTNVAPWLITVGASSIDRSFPAPIVLADGTEIQPDIIAPGSDILGAWTERDGPTRNGNGGDQRRTKYNLMSGTSVAAPHVAAAAVLLKAIHPTWSAAAIKSAIMTTASTIDNTGNPITDQHGKPATPFVMGSGHLQPVKAADPGLVYDASYDNYLLYTCGLGITHAMKLPYRCPASVPEAANLNYPSIQIHGLNGTKTATRRVTNVGQSNSIYKFHSLAPKEYTITASPNVLKFDHLGQELSFNITITAVSWNFPTKYDPDFYYFGSYAWIDHEFVVRSPVAVSFT